MLLDVGGREIDRDPAQRELQPRVLDRAADALPRLLYGGIGQANDGKHRHAGRNIHFHAHNVRINAENGARIYL